MAKGFVNIGYGNIIASSRLVTIVRPDSSPVKRLISEARDNGTLIDVTYGRRTRAVLVMDSGHVVLSAVHPETVANRMEGGDESEEER